MSGVFPWFSDWIYQVGDKTSDSCPYTKQDGETPYPLRYGDSILLFDGSNYKQYASSGPLKDVPLASSATRVVVDTGDPTVQNPVLSRGNQVLYGDKLFLSMVDSDAVIDGQTIGSVPDSDSGYRVVLNTLDMYQADGDNAVNLDISQYTYSITGGGDVGTPVYYGDPGASLTMPLYGMTAMSQLCIVNQRGYIPLFDTSACPSLAPCSDCPSGNNVCSDGTPAIPNTTTCAYECVGVQQLSCSNYPPGPSTCVSGSCDATGCTNGNNNPTCDTEDGLYDCTQSLPWYFYLVAGLVMALIMFIMFFADKIL